MRIRTISIQGSWSQLQDEVNKELEKIEKSGYVSEIKLLENEKNPYGVLTYGVMIVYSDLMQGMDQVPNPELENIE